MQILFALIIFAAVVSGAFGFAGMIMARSTALHGSKAAAIPDAAAKPLAWSNLKWDPATKLWVPNAAVAPSPAKSNMWQGMTYDAAGKQWVLDSAQRLPAVAPRVSATSKSGRRAGATALMSLVLSGVDIMQALPDHLSSM